MYEKALKRRDNFILAAIKADDDFMKALWIQRAEEQNKLLKLYGNYTVGDMSK